MAPVQKPTTDHFRSSRKSINIQTRALRKWSEWSSHFSERISPSRSSQVSVEDGHGGFEGGGKAGSSVETHPADPQESGTENDLTARCVRLDGLSFDHPPDVGRLENDSLGSPSSSLANEVRVCETSNSRGNFDWSTSSIWEKKLELIACQAG
jgi:hypothetical protein